jgi:hypothetical protein
VCKDVRVRTYVCCQFRWCLCCFVLGHFCSPLPLTKLARGFRGFRGFREVSPAAGQWCGVSSLQGDAPGASGCSGLPVPSATPAALCRKAPRWARGWVGDPRARCPPPPPPPPSGRKNVVPGVEHPFFQFQGCGLIRGRLGVVWSPPALAAFARTK